MIPSYCGLISRYRGMIPGYCGMIPRHCRLISRYLRMIPRYREKIPRYRGIFMLNRKKLLKPLLVIRKWLLKEYYFPEPLFRF